MIKVRAHTCYLGQTGYANHSRNFFRALSKYVDLRVRNFTWDEDLSYVNDLDRSIVDTITLMNDDGQHIDYPIGPVIKNGSWKEQDPGFQPDVDLVLMDVDHHYFYDEYTAKVKIAYTVWESTLLPEHFFEQLLKFDFLWVVTEWHKKMAIAQGYPKNRIFVVNEGVDLEEMLRPPILNINSVKEDAFRFSFFGRWDYRKSVPEIVTAFLNVFKGIKDVELVLCADNPYSVDGMSSTEERLEHYGLTDPKIKVKHWMSREEYLSTIVMSNVLVTCARSEGWNIPLLEAMCLGTPVIYSDWGGQLEFAEGTSVKILEERPAELGAKLGFAQHCPGNYAEPDFKDLEVKMLECYQDYSNKKELAKKLRYAKMDKFNWNLIAIEAKNVIQAVVGTDYPKADQDNAAIVLSHADTDSKKLLLRMSVNALKHQGMFVIVTSHIPVEEGVVQSADVVYIKKDNPVIYPEEYEQYTNTVPIHYMRYPDFDISYSFDYNHGYAAMTLMKAGAVVAEYNDKEFCHVVNYDYVLTNDLTIEKQKAKLKSDDSRIYGFNWDAEKEMNTGFFSCSTQILLTALGDIGSKKDYFKFKDTVILEGIMYNAFLDYSCGDPRIFDLLPSDELHRTNNIINGSILQTYPKIGTEKDAFAYMVETPEGLVLSIVSFNESKITFTASSGEFKAVGSAVAGSPWFLKVPRELLKNGVKLFINETNETFEYDETTRRANGTINGSVISREWEKMIKNNFVFNFIDGPFFEALGVEERKYRVDFIDLGNGSIVFSTEIRNNNWTRCNRKYYTDWLIRVTDLNTGEITEHRQDLKGKRVMISMESSSLGDTIAWFPFVKKFADKHGCQVHLSTFKNEMFETEEGVTLIRPGQSVDGLYASYRIGWFYKGEHIDLDWNPREVKELPLQTTASDILGLEPEEIRPNLVKVEQNHVKKKYVCLGIHSTSQAKYWNNPTGWQELTDYFIDKHMDVVVVSVEGDGFMGNMYPKRATEVQSKNRTILETMKVLEGAEMFIGVGSGLSWLSWAMNKKTVIISGFSLPYTEPNGEGIVRVFNPSVCNGCFNRKRLDPSNWMWCPDQRNTSRQFECTKSITAAEVIAKIEGADWLHKEGSIEDIIAYSVNMGMVQNYSEIYGAAKFVKDLKIKDFIEIGTDQGGSFAIWSKVAAEKDGIKISIDMPHGQFGRADYDVVARDKYLRSLGGETHMLHGDSHSITMIERTRNLLKGRQVDFMFIDGDHTYEGVKQDLKKYKEFVKSGGWIGFHDIKDTEFHRKANCRVDQLWNELIGTKIEFVDESSDFGGIGFIQV